LKQNPAFLKSLPARDNHEERLREAGGERYKPRHSLFHKYWGYFMKLLFLRREKPGKSHANPGSFLWL